MFSIQCNEREFLVPIHDMTLMIPTIMTMMVAMIMTNSMMTATKMTMMMTTATTTMTMMTTTMTMIDNYHVNNVHHLHHEPSLLLPLLQLKCMCMNCLHYELQKSITIIDFALLYLAYICFVN